MPALEPEVPCSPPAAVTLSPVSEVSVVAVAPEPFDPSVVATRLPAPDFDALPPDPSEPPQAVRVRASAAVVAARTVVRIRVVRLTGRPRF
ncbi:hypothetical protein [Streptomyces sp. NPDC058644]|uniref:hypothetical protein n=1 Tax=unclassified Streptomyces TaxID=2593676 RepID=UPI0036596B6A